MGAQVSTLFYSLIAPDIETIGVKHGVLHPFLMAPSMALSHGAEPPPPDPLRLCWRELIKKTIREVVLNPQTESIQIIERAVAKTVSDREREAVWEQTLRIFGRRKE